MSKITKKDLNERLLMVETLLGLHRALPEQISNDQANNAIFRMQCALSSGKELAERKPQLKQLDQSVFDGLDEKWRFAAVDSDGVASYYDGIPEIRKDHFIYLDAPNGAGQSYRLSGTYDASNWKNSLIERDTAKELAGSELCKAMLARGDKYVMCRVNNDNNIQVISGWTYYGFISETNNYCLFKTPIPINNQGEPLTAAEAGL